MTIRVNLRWVLVAVVLLLAVGAFLFLDFAVGQTNVALNGKSDTYNVGQTQGQTVSVGSKLAVYVEGGGGLGPALANALVTTLPKRTPFTEIKVLDALTDRVGSPVLMVEISRTLGIWTPVLAVHALGLRASFASDGQTAWRHDPKVVIAAAADPTVRLRLDLNGDVNGFGILSRPGYYRGVAEKVAAQIGDAVAPQVGRSGGG